MPTWVKQGETFESELNEDSYSELDFVEDLHPLLARRVREHLRKWYPVQRTVLPHLLTASSMCSILPPRFLQFDLNLYKIVGGHVSHVFRI